MLTQKQKNNIQNLDAQTCLEVFNECVERLAVVTAEEYAALTFTPRRTVFAQIKKGTIKTVEISGRKFPIINF